QHGTIRFGNGPKTSALDANCKARPRQSLCRGRKLLPVERSRKPGADHHGACPARGRSLAGPPRRNKCQTVTKPGTGWHCRLADRPRLPKVRKNSGLGPTWEGRGFMVPLKPFSFVIPNRFSGEESAVGLRCSAADGNRNPCRAGRNSMSSKRVIRTCQRG